jgi:hypothetical protein
MRIRRFFHTVLAVIALGILWQTVHTWSRALPGVQPEAARSRAQDRPATALPARALQTGQRLARQITDQDLFAPDRQRPAVVQQAVSTEPPPPPAHLTLVGVLLTPGREEAFLADSSQGNRVTRVQTGESIGDLYRLTRLTASEATLSLGNGGGEVALPLALLSSKKAKSLPRLTPKQAAAAKPARQPAQSPAATEAGGDDPAQIRENIRQLQRRLRLLRRQAARERRAERAKEERAETEAPAAEPE